INDDKADVVVDFETPRFRAHLEKRDARGVINPDRSVAENSCSTTESHEFVVVKFSFSQPLRVDASLRCEQALNELLLAHFEREERDWHVVIESCVLSNVQHEGRFTHRGTSCNN